MGLGANRIGLKALAVTLALSACNAAGTNANRRLTTPAPQPVVVAPILTPGPESIALAAYYESVQRGLLTQGLLRTDGGGADTPFTAAMLARNFERIAFFQEYAPSGGLLVARENASHLTRWIKPVRISITFGASVAQDKRDKDRQTLSAYTQRLARVTGHSIRNVKEGANFHVYVLSEDDRRGFGPELRRLVPGISAASQRAVLEMPRDTYCLVFARDPSNTGQFDQAVAVIRSEHPDLMRTACLHEEVAQGLGLSNDSPQARPSIFNDDEEFGLLTTHDEMLLRMLYDTRLRPGMSATEARPIINDIAAELLGGPV